MSEDLAATLLLELRLRAFAPTDVLAAAAGVSPTVVASALGVYESEHWVQRRDGRVVGWSLTAAGRRHGRDLLVSELAAADATDAVADAYLDFLPLNAELLSICTDWQVVVVDGEHTLNDHGDAARDVAVIGRLGRLQPKAIAITDGLARRSRRFSRYGPRLTESYDHVVAGRTEWLTRASGSSYHGVWFELHEHLLTVLGYERHREPVPVHTPTNVPTPGGGSNHDPAPGDPRDPQDGDNP